MKTDSKSKSVKVENPLTNSERDQKITEATDFHKKRMSQRIDFESKRESANKPVGNSEFEQAVAEDVNFNIDSKIAEAAYFLAKRRNFAPGNEASDWFLAERSIEGVVSADLVERRNGTINDRRNAAIHDRRI